jgi:three-Cys-motif partner protein
VKDASFVPEVGPWAEDKLACLRKYLSAYTTILRKQSFKGYVYVDAFAGTGTAKIRKKKAGDAENQAFLSALGLGEDQGQERFILGSPRIALEIDHSFTHYVFVELDEKRRKELHKLQQQYGASRDIKIHDQNCNEYLSQLVAKKGINWREWRGVVFLDPFGTHVPWKTIEGLARTQSFEAFINFPCMAINRLAKNDGNITEHFRQILNEYFGSPEWFDVMYQEESGLFGPLLNKVDDASKALLNWYRKRLKAEFGLASRARLIRNTKNSPLYYLLWAGPNPTGQRIANYRRSDLLMEI